MPQWTWEWQMLSPSSPTEPSAGLCSGTPHSRLFLISHPTANKVLEKRNFWHWKELGNTISPSLTPSEKKGKSFLNLTQSQSLSLLDAVNEWRRREKACIDYRRLTPKGLWKCGRFSHSFKKNRVGFRDAIMLVWCCKLCLMLLIALLTLLCKVVLQKLSNVYELGVHRKAYSVSMKHAIRYLKGCFSSRSHTSNNNYNFKSLI